MVVAAAFIVFELETAASKARSIVVCGKRGERDEDKKLLSKRTDRKKRSAWRRR